MVLIKNNAAAGMEIHNRRVVEAISREDGHVSRVENPTEKEFFVVLFAKYKKWY
jgi:hypothetical protein